MINPFRTVWVVTWHQGRYFDEYAANDHGVLGVYTSRADAEHFAASAAATLSANAKAEHTEPTGAIEICETQLFELPAAPVAGPDADPPP